MNELAFLIIFIKRYGNLFQYNGVKDKGKNLYFRADVGSALGGLKWEVRCKSGAIPVAVSAIEWSGHTPHHCSEGTGRFSGPA